MIGLKMLLLSNKKDLLYSDKNRYTTISNIIFIIIYKQWKARKFEKKLIVSLYKGIFQNNEIPLGCVKTKVSQLRKYENTGDEFGISNNLIELFDSVKNVDYNKLKFNLEQALNGGYANFYNLK